MGKYKAVCVGAVLAFGAGMVAPVGVMAEANPTSCDGIDNCEIITSGEDLSNFFTSTTGRFVTRAGESTMIIGADLTMPKDFYIENSNIKMYLGNHTISADECSFLMYNSTLDIYADGGSISNAEEENVYGPLYVRNDSNVTLHSGTIRGGLLGGYDSAVNVENGSTFTMNGGEIYGASWVVAVYADSEFVMNGGIITTTGEGSIGVTGNGTTNPSSPNYGSNAKLTLNAGTINSSDLGVYAPQAGGVTTLGEDLTINAEKAGVEVRAGELIVDGATINVPETAEYVFNPNGNGSTASGVAIAVSQHTTKQPITATVYSGEFTAPVAFAEANPQHNADEDVALVDVEIAGGTFNATSDELIVTSEDVTGFVYGGIYNKAFDTKYLADGYSLYTAGNKYTVLETMTPEGSDESESGDAEAVTENEKTLAEVSDKVMGALIEAFVTEPTKREFETSDGYKFVINDEIDLVDILTSGATISSSLVSTSDVVLSDDDEALVAEVMEHGATKFGVMDYAIVLKADGVLIGQVVEIPEALVLNYDASEAPEVAEGYERSWRIIRLHEGSVTVFDGIYDSETKMVTFYSDEFSAYVITYVDNLVDSESSSSVTTPETGVANGINSDVKVNAVIVATIVAVVTGMVAAWKLVVKRM